MNFVTSLLPAIEHFHTIGYWIAFFSALLETTAGVGLIFPGSTIILFMGALSARGYFDLGDLLWFAIIGAILGDQINYYIGKKYGRKILKKGLWFLKPSHFEKGKKFFDVYGPKSVFIGRFIPGVKEIAPLIAGMFGMKKATFLAWDILGGIGWGLAWTLPGYVLSQSLDFAKIWLTRAGFFLAILAVVFVIFYLIKIFLVKKGKQFFSFFASIWNSIKQPLIDNPDVQKIAKRHQIFFRFIENRLSTKKFTGLPLTLLFLALLYTLSLFGGIMEDVINSDVIVSVDIRVAHLLQIFRSAELIKIFLWITLLGKWQIVSIFTLATVLILWLTKKRAYIIPLFVSILGSELLTFIGKYIFHRPRPDAPMYPETSFSFPSGHATIAVAFYGFLTYLLIRNAKEWSKKINALFAGFVLIVLIGFSRLYLGVHYVSDVWGGYLAGAIWLIIAISLAEHFSYGKKGTKEPGLNAKKRFIVPGLILASVGFYMIYALNYQPPASIVSPEAKQIEIIDVNKIFTQDQLKYTETLLGNRQEPLSFIILAANDQQLTSLFVRAGWSLADDVTIPSLIETAKAAIQKKPYQSAPMTPDFWNAVIHDFGFEKSTQSNNPRERHHARFWKTNYVTKDGDSIYVGTASFDKGIK